MRWPRLTLGDTRKLLELTPSEDGFCVYDTPPNEIKGSKPMWISIVAAL